MCHRQFSANIKEDAELFENCADRWRDRRTRTSPLQMSSNILALLL